MLDRRVEMARQALDATLDEESGVRRRMNAVLDNIEKYQAMLNDSRYAWKKDMMADIAERPAWASDIIESIRQDITGQLSSAIDDKETQDAVTHLVEDICTSAAKAATSDAETTSKNLERLSKQWAQEASHVDRQLKKARENPLLQPDEAAEEENPDYTIENSDSDIEETEGIWDYDATDDLSGIPEEILNDDFSTTWDDDLSE